MSTFAWPGASGGGTGSNASVSGNGIAIPASSTLVAGENPSGNQQPLQTDAQGDLLVSVSGSALPAGAATAANQTTGNISLASIDGKTPALGQAAAAASTPVVIASNQSAVPVSGTFFQATQPVSGTVSVSNFPASQAVTGTFFQATQPVSGTVSTTVADTSPATQNITVVDAGSTSNSYYNGQVWYSGTPTTGSVASFAVGSIETGQLQVSGTWTGTLQFEISVDSGVTWIAHAIHQIGSAAFNSSCTNNVVGSLNLAAKTNFRVRATSAMTGTAVIRLIDSLNGSTIYVANAIKLVDSLGGTQGTIKAASTAAASTDTALVVAISPNNTVPTDQAPSTTSAVTSVSAAITSTSLLASNTARKGALFYNSSTAILYLKYGTAASTSSYSVQIPANGYYELPDTKIYNGAITGVWSAASGSVLVTELS